MEGQGRSKQHNFAPGPVQAVRFDERFLEASSKWLQDDEIRRLTLSSHFSKERQLAWYAGLAERADYLIWGIEHSGEPIGVFGLKNLDGRSAEYWGYIGNKAYWGRGIGRWMIKKAIYYARNRGLTRLYLKVSRENTRAVRLYLGAGFIVYAIEGALYFMERGL
jgi:RimJ/RimL family protein N-acetyltransferase